MEGDGAIISRTLASGKKKSQEVSIHTYVVLVLGSGSGGL